MTVVHTIGHSTHPIDEFIGLLEAHGIELLVDVRTVAGSRRNPQFNAESLGRSLRAAGIEYRRMAELGGLRRTVEDSVNDGWRNASFRGYADYMQTPAFAEGIDRLIEAAAEQTVAIMCAEAVPWRCHRSLIGDALLIRGVEVRDIMSVRSSPEHRLTTFARVEGMSLTYPADPSLELPEG